MAYTPAFRPRDGGDVSFIARNHPQQVKTRGALSSVDDRATTWEVFNPLHERFKFTIDVAASADNAKLPRYFTAEVNGLEQSWAGERVWCNPPYSDIRPWVEKAWREYEPGQAELIVMLVPANRTEQPWWQEEIEPWRDSPVSSASRHDPKLKRRLFGLDVEFLAGRVRFLAPGTAEIKPNARPPFGCCLLIWGGWNAREILTTVDHGTAGT
jgi:hypothetical protein